MFGLWLALTFCAVPPETETAEIQLTADRLLHDGKKDLTTAEGRATLVTEDAAIDADRIVFDRNRNVATATGHVVARITQGGRIAVIADVMTLRLDEQQRVKEIFLYDGQALSKKDVSAQALLEANTAQKVEKAGTTQALLQGNHLTRVGPTQWRVDELDLVPCECDFKNPSWSISSSSATIDTEAERVAVTNPVFRVKHVPVLWLPWVSLPLTFRQSGLLFTRPNFSPLNGFSLEQPIFLTLGRSADVTLTPGYFFGAPKRDGFGRVNNGVEGPRLSTEFRYAPSSRATGKVVLGLLYDFRTRRDVDSAANNLRSFAGGPRGLRGEFSWLHTQDFGSGFGARADVNAHSDGDYNRDISTDVIVSSATYLRSTASVFHRGEDHYVGLEVGLRQDIEWGYDLLGRGTLLDPLRPETEFGKFGPGTLQRLPAFTFGWLPSGRLGPLRFEVQGEAVRLAPLFSNTGDEGIAANGGAVGGELFATAVNRLFGASRARAPGTGDRLWEPGEREARDRLMVLPKFSISGQPLEAFSASAFVAWRQLAWAGEASGQSWSRGYLLLGGRLETELSRSFGSLRHVIQPLAEVRAIATGLEGSTGAPVAYDAVDAAVPNIAPRFQGVLELRQRLVGPGGAEVLRLDVGQGFELSGPTYAALVPTLGETYARLGVRIGWFSTQGQVRIDPLGSRFATASERSTSLNLNPIVPTRIAAQATFDDGRHGVYGAYENLLMEGTARSRQPLDLLFLIDRGFTSATRLQQLTLGAHWDFGPISLRYDALIGESLVVGSTVPVLTLKQHTATVGISPACDCWRVDLYATQSVNLYATQGTAALAVPNFGFNVTISKFGSIGAR